MLILFVILSGSIASADDGGEFADAIAYAQARTVKIYGAGIGRATGYGTGILVSGDGKIVAASGVYLSRGRVTVTLPDGSIHQAQVLHRSESLQTALLKIDAVTPEFFKLSETNVAGKGDWVLAVSNAFKVADGREPLSVNLGVVSLRTRLEVKRGTQDVPYQGDVLLIDAITSNPGAPGGAVVTTKGELAAMVGRIIESKDTGTRLNYAVPVDLLHKFVAKPDDEKPVVASTEPSGKAFLGIRLFTLGGKRAAAYVDRVVPGSPAAKAGIRPDDLILAVGNETVNDIRQYEEVEQALVPEKEITLVVKRKQQLLQIQITPTAGGKE